MSEPSTEACDRKLIPRQTTLNCRVYGNSGLDPLKLRDVADHVHDIVCGPIPGDVIRRIEFDGHDLTIVIGEATS